MGRISRSRHTYRFRLLFWYLGLIPDIATVRDRAVTKAQVNSGMDSLPWDGTVLQELGTDTKS